MKYKKYVETLLLCAGFFMFTAVTHAQTFTLNTSELTLSPEYPTPNSEVALRFNISSNDIQTSLITWRVNGEVVQEAYGEDSYFFTVGNVGDSYVVTVEAKKSNGRIIKKTISFTVNDVDFLWEANTYTPHFFKGRALYSSGSTVTVFAIPQVYNSEGKRLSPSSLIYTWKFNRGIRVNNDSDDNTVHGKGLDVVHVSDIFGVRNITGNLTIQTLAGDVVMAKNVNIPIVTPVIKFYESDPYLGVWYNSTLGDQYVLNKKEAVIVAEPFYVVANNRYDENLQYEWNIAQNTYNFRGSIMLRPQKGSGTERLTLSITNTDTVLQGARGETNITFSANAVNEKTTL